MSNAEIVQKYELWHHLVAILWPLVAGLILVGLQLFTVTGLVCWLGPEPLGCQLVDMEYDCTNNQRAYLYAWMFTGTPVIVLNLSIAFAMNAETTQKAQTYAFEASRKSIKTRNAATKNVPRK